MEILELATLLGKTIKEDERVQKMQEATKAYESNEALQAQIAEYNAQSAALTEEHRKEQKDQEMIDAIQARIESLYHTIVENPILIAYNSATEAVNALMNEVNSEITFQITGERPCAHDCSSCGGGCGHDHHH